MTIINTLAVHGSRFKEVPFTACELAKRSGPLKVAVCSSFPVYHRVFLFSGTKQAERRAGRHQGDQDGAR